MRKIVSIFIIITVLLALLTGCKEPVVEYPENVVSELTEGVDYVVHTSTYDGEGLSYNESMWYVNMLEDVPLADPQVFAEDGVYYIVGTSDRDNNVVDCYTTVEYIILHALMAGRRKRLRSMLPKFTASTEFIICITVPLIRTASVVTVL